MKEEHLEKLRVDKPSLLERVLAHMDLVAAVAATALLALVVLRVFASGDPELESTRAALGKVATEVTEAIDGTRFDLDAGAKLIEDRYQRVSKGWSVVPGAPPEGSAEDVYPATLVAALRRGEVNEVVFLPPKGLSAEPGRGVIELRWMEHEDNNTRPKAFVIIRSSDGGGGEEIAQVSGDTLSYEDKAVRAGERYTYQVISLTDEPILLAQNQGRTSPSEAVTVEAVADFKITLATADPDRKEAVFKVEKWQDGVWFDKRFTVPVGGVVGEKDAGSGIDYATGRVFASIAAEPGSRSLVRREVVFDPDGRVAIEGGVVVTEEVTLVEEFVVVKAALEGGGLPSSTLTLEKR